jgi:hypothetical protein
MMVLSGAGAGSGGGMGGMGERGSFFSFTSFPSADANAAKVTARPPASCSVHTQAYALVRHALERQASHSSCIPCPKKGRECYTAKTPERVPSFRGLNPSFTRRTSVIH